MSTERMRRDESDLEVEWLASFPKLNPNPVIELDESGRVVFANEASKKSLKESGLKSNPDFFIPPDIDVILKKLKQGKKQQIQREIIVGREIFLERINLVPKFRTIRIYANNITKRIEAEINLKKLNKELERRVGERTAELSKHGRAISMLSACNTALVHARQEAKLLKEICQIIVKVGGYKMAWVGVAEKDAQKSVLPVAQVGFEDGYLEKANISWSDKILRGLGPTGRAIQERKIHFGRYLSTDPALAPWRKEALKRGFASSIALPLEAQNNLFGALTVYAEDPKAFDKKETALLKELADDLAFGILSLRTRESSEKNRRHLIATNRLLTISHEAISRKAYLDAVVKYLKSLSRCAYAGVRILDKKGFIPYDAYVGFDQNFYQSENQLSLGKDHCACVRVISGKLEREDAPATTKYGSFYTTDSHRFISELNGAGRLKFRGKCTRCGFASIAIIPIHSQGKIIGAIHIADKKPRALSLEKVEFIESLTPLIGEGIIKFNTSDQLKESERKYRELVENVNSVILRLDTRGHITFFNEFAEKFFGYRKEEIIGRNSVGTIIPKTESSGRDLALMMKDIIKNPARYIKNENENIKKNGERVWLVWRNRALYDKQGKLEGILSVGNDVTDRKMKEEQLLESYKHAGTINRRISFLSELSQLTVRYKNKKKIILERMLGPLINFSGANIGALFKYEEGKGNAFRMLSSSGAKSLTAQEIKGVSEKNKEILRILAKGRSCLRGRCKDLPLGKLSSNKNLKYCMLIPLNWENRPRAFIFLGFGSQPDFSNQDLEFFDVFSVYASALLADAKIF